MLSITGTASVRLATGSPPAAPFVWGIREARVTTDLTIYTGDNLRLEFLAADNKTVEHDAVIWSRTSPGAQTVALTNLTVPHDDTLPYPSSDVKRIKLVLTDNSGSVISDNMAWYTVVKDDFTSRIGWIIINWANHSAADKDQLSSEITQIIINWASVSSTRDQGDFSQ
jgi:hypothetical protein